MDRDEILRRAEKLLRQGRLDAAIAEYEKLVEDAPRDWVSANILGDLYVRAGQIEQAVGHYKRSAEHLAREGFVSKATALYKKVVKIHPEDDAALLRAAELSASQGLTAEARLHLQGLFQQRMRRGDRAGAAQAAALLADLDPGNAAGRVESARMLAGLGDAPGAAAQFRLAGQVLLAAGKIDTALQTWREGLSLSPDDEITGGLLVDVLLESGDTDGAREVARTAGHWRSVAVGFLRMDRDDDAVGALDRALQADPADLASRVHLARSAMAHQDAARARDLLAPVAGSSDPMVLLALAEVEFRSGAIDLGRAALQRSLASRDDLAQPAIELGCGIGRTAPEIGFAVIAAVVQSAESRGDTDLALDAVERFLSVAPGDVAALEELIRVCGQGFYEHQQYRAQVQLADAYLSLAKWEQARSLSEELVKARPDDAGHVQRLARAKAGLGIADRDPAPQEPARVAGVSGGTTEFAAAPPPPSELTEDVSCADAAGPAAAWLMPSDARLSRLAVPPQAAVATPEPDAADAGWLVDAADLGLETPIDLDAELNRERVSPKPDAPEHDVFELDISGELEDLLSLARGPQPAAGAPAPAAPAPAPAPAAPAPAPPGDPRGLDGYFEGLRDDRARGAEGVASALAYDQASEYFNSGELDSAVECLRTAARDPLIRFRAASMLARIARDRNRLGEAVEWLERASEAPAPSVEASHGLLYELGDALQSEGEDARALAVFLELQSSAPGYRDVGTRISKLSARDSDWPGPGKGLP